MAILRRGARRLPQLSLPPSADPKIQAQTPTTQEAVPASYTPVWLELKELLRRMWLLEGSIQGGDIVVPSSMYNGKPTASLCVLRWPSTETFTFPASLTGSKGIARTAATAQTDFDVQANAVSFGTMRWAAAGTVPTFIAASTQAVVPGTIIEVFAPATPDATLANIGFGLRGIR
jgi:hypothetical protein